MQEQEPINQDASQVPEQIQPKRRSKKPKNFVKHNYDSILELLAINQAYAPYRIDPSTLIRWEEYRDILYAPNTGKFYRFKISGKYFWPCGNPQAMLFEIWYSDVYQFNLLKKSNGRRTFKNANFLAWEIINQKFVPKDSYVFMKDMNLHNLVQQNIAIATRADYKCLRDALRNREGVLKLSQQVNMLFKVRYRENSSIKVKRFYEETAAKEFYKSIQLRDAKLLSRFHISIVE